MSEEELVEDSGRAQDDARERQLIDLFGLKSGRGRTSSDAVMVVRGDYEALFELKSTTTGKGVSTVRDLGHRHFLKWRGRHWLIGVYKGRTELQYCVYASPADMLPWIEKQTEYMKADFRLAELVPAKVTMDILEAIVGRKKLYSLEDAQKLHKRQYSAEKYLESMDVPPPAGRPSREGGYTPKRMLDILRDRCAYVLNRGATLNNPSIPMSYFKDFERIDPTGTTKARARLRALVQAYIDEQTRIR